MPVLQHHFWSLTHQTPLLKTTIEKWSCCEFFNVWETRATFSQCSGPTHFSLGCLWGRHESQHSTTSSHAMWKIPITDRDWPLHHCTYFWDWRFDIQLTISPPSSWQQETDTKTKLITASVPSSVPVAKWQSEGYQHPPANWWLQYVATSVCPEILCQIISCLAGQTL